MDAQEPPPAASRIFEYAKQLDPSHVQERRLLRAAGTLILLCSGALTAAAAWFAMTVVQTEQAVDIDTLRRVLDVAGEWLVLGMLLAGWGFGAIAPRRWASAVALGSVTIVALVACDELADTMLARWSRRQVMTAAQWVTAPAYALVILAIAGAMTWLFTRPRMMVAATALDRSPRWADSLPLPVSAACVVALVMAMQSLVHAGTVLMGILSSMPVTEAAILLLGRVAMMCCLTIGGVCLAKRGTCGWGWLLAAFLVEGALAFVALARFNILWPIGFPNRRLLAYEQQMLTYGLIRACALLTAAALLRKWYGRRDDAAAALDAHRDEVSADPITPRKR